MLQDFLEDRFNLKVHRETKVVPAYNLVVAKGGLKLKEFVPITNLSSKFGIARSTDNKARDSATENDLEANGFGLHGVRPGGVLELPEGPEHVMMGNAATISRLALILQLGELEGAPVIDKTGLTEPYDFRLAFARSAIADQGDYPVPGLIPALEEELGLKLEPTKSAIEMLVIDHIDSTPAAN